MGYNLNFQNSKYKFDASYHEDDGSLWASWSTYTGSEVFELETCGFNNDYVLKYYLFPKTNILHD